jgi:phytoene dehydrogenase-like protein
VGFKKNSRVAKIEVENNIAKRVVLENGEIIEGRAIVSNADPFTTRDIVGSDKFSNQFN